ncbi:2-keto-4-pentenoate hydratase [Sphingopyxis sp.]|uniref:2-keto-4-pentenoate hydratase n=1 Tax=Sphingopyxis sp. TaxID=1908224 RepID=UPI002D7790F3|nr:fumarylacetoacetate hydrolase family protein [Sphingopyxis sp.]HET6523095.1 fumarylacetoacetate hydrolase family protein [Sphingopyxis sp.]
MGTTTLQAAAADLRNAYGGSAIAPLRGVLEPADVEGAYEVQSINTRAWQEAGRKIVGRKVGLTAKAVQAQLGVDQPDFGVLFDDMRIEEAGTLRSSQVLQPKAEAEIAVVLGKDLDGEIDLARLADAVEFIAPAIEIVDSRIADWKISFADTVADNGSSAFFVLGDARLPLAGLDLYSCGMVLEVNGEVVSLGAGAACLGHPLNAALWLARTLEKRGEPLRKGDIVLTGALGPMVAIKPGDHVVARIGGVGDCSFKFLKDE